LHDTHPELAQNLIWVEVDYDTVVEKKTQVIKSTNALNQRIINNHLPDTDYMIHSDNYILFSMDIRNSAGLTQKLTEDFKIH